MTLLPRQTLLPRRLASRLQLGQNARNHNRSGHFYVLALSNSEVFPFIAKARPIKNVISKPVTCGSGIVRSTRLYSGFALVDGHRGTHI